MRALPCDILITAHADQDSAFDRFRTATPGACRAYALVAARLARRIAEERRGAR
jgi:metallo-beta-lactamase class B